MSRAGISVTLKVDAVAERATLEALRSLQPRYLRAAVRNAVRKGSRPMLRAVKARVRVEHGFTKKALGVKVRTFKDNNIIAVIGPRRGPKFVYSAPGPVITLSDRSVVALRRYNRKRVPANTMHLQELGVRPHRLGRGVQLGRGAARRGATRDQRGAMHPGVKADHALRDGFAAGRAEAQAIVRRELAAEVEKQARKQAARQAARAAAGAAAGGG